MTVDAIVDGGGVIDERNESNNEREASLTMTAPEKTETDDVESGISTTTIYIGSLIALVLILLACTIFAPAKVKKYDGKAYYGEPNTPGFDEQGKVIRKVE